MNVSLKASTPDWLARKYKYIRLEWEPEFSLLRLRTCVKPIQCYKIGRAHV